MMKSRLKFLTGMASLSVALLIGLQVFWLVSLYRQEQKRFYRDVENALMEAMVAAKMSVAVISGNNAVNKELTQKIVQGILTGDKKNLRSDMNELSTQYLETLGNDSSLSKDDLSAFMDTANVVINLGDGKGSEDIPLAVYKEYTRTALVKRDIKIPFELAAVDMHGNITEATIDIEVYKSMTHIVPEAVGFGTEPGAPDIMIEAGFTGLTMYFLGKMTWLLILSVIFIPLFIYSYIYLLSTFFRQKKISEIRNDFINNMTHELKTPISGVSVALELVADETQTADNRKEYIGLAQNELKRLTLLVEKVLNMAAFEKNEISIAQSRIILEPFIGGIVNDMRPVVERNNGVITYKVTPTDLYIIADSFHLRNLVQNLIDNAIKYNDKPRPQIDIALYEEDANIIICVADNGKGIPAAYADKVFDKFFRVPAGDLHDVKGYGLGLSYVKEIVQLHKGSVALQSQLGAGSTFIIRLPKEQR